MRLTISQAAAQLGRTVRQVRYMIQQGSVQAKKVHGRWLIESRDLPKSDGQEAAAERKGRQLRGLVDEALAVPEKPARRYSVLDLKAFQIGLRLYRRAAEELGEEHVASTELRRMLALLAQGCHRYEGADKARAYREARDAASLAVCELVLADSPAASDLLHDIEQDLMASMAGLLRRAERWGRRR